MNGDTRSRKLLPVTWDVTRTHFKLTLGVRTVTKSPLLTCYLHCKRQKYPPQDVVFKIPTPSLFYVLGSSSYKSSCRESCSTQSCQSRFGLAVAAV